MLLNLKKLAKYTKLNEHPSSAKIKWVIYGKLKHRKAGKIGENAHKIINGMLSAAKDELLGF